MAISEVSICNASLLYTGSYRIQSLTQLNSKEARACNTLYELSRDSVLEDHDWGFARSEATLALLSDTYSGWDYAYAFPTGCLVPRSIYDGSEVEGADPIDYEIRVNDTFTQNIILTDKQNAVLIFTAKVENPVLFSALFASALSYKLASDLAVPLKSDKNMKVEMLNNYYTVRGQAKSSNSNAGSRAPSESSSFTRARL